MPAEPDTIVVLGDSAAECAGVLSETEGARLTPMTWGDLDLGAPERMVAEAVLCHASPLMLQRRGLVSILRRAFPEVPFFSFSRSGEPPPALCGEALGLDGHLSVPIAAENLRMLIARETRLRSMARHYREALGRVREQSEKLDLLIETAKAANSLLEPTRVMQLVMDRTQEYLGSEAWSFYLLIENAGENEFEVTRGCLGQEAATVRRSAACGIAGWVVRHRRPAAIDDVSRDSRWQDEPPRAGGPAVQSVLCIPLASRGRIIGAAELVNKAGGGTFGERDIDTLRTMLEPAAITIENAILFKKLEEMSVTDDLTRLYNSRYLNHFLQQEVKRSKRYGYSVTLLFLDLDGFKSVNDRHGHLAGSRTLVEVGKVVRGMVRETDIVSRYGGDEFTVVLPQTGVDGAVIIAEKIRAALEEHTFLESMGHAIRLTASVGVACYPEHGDSREDLIGHADRAMYRVKERGKNGVELAFHEQSV